MKNTIPQEFIDKAAAALAKSAFWEIADSPVTLRIAMREAEIDGRRVNQAARKAARQMIKRVSDPLVRAHLHDIAYSSDTEKRISELENRRDSLIRKVAGEFVEVEKADSVSDYRAKRAKRVGIFGRPAGIRGFNPMNAIVG